MTGRRWPSRSLASLALVGAIVAAGGACSSRRAPSDVEAIDRALAKGAAYLVAKQDADGAIRSPTYAAFRDGYALTGMAAMVLGFSKETAAHERAVAFLSTMVDGSGPDGAMKDVAYPTYAAALAVLVLNKDKARATTRDALREVLRTRQLVAVNGWSEADASYGGWGYYPRVPKRPAGEVMDDLLSSNLSATVLAVGALTLGGVPVEDPALVAARGFVERCQNEDGGFFFSPAVPDANKAGKGDGGYSSYGSMTADGVRALVRLGGNEERVKRGAAWLERNFEADRNPGVFVGGAEIRRASAYYYWTWSAAHALRAIGKPELDTANGKVVWATALARALLARQRDDGSWKNDATEMREDDPVVATSFAMAALTVCRNVISGEYRSHAGWALVP